jgi:hypothetical protein
MFSDLSSRQAMTANPRSVVTGSFLSTVCLVPAATLPSLAHPAAINTAPRTGDTLRNPILFEANTAFRGLQMQPERAEAGRRRRGKPRESRVPQGLFQTNDGEE